MIFFAHSTTVNPKFILLLFYFRCLMEYRMCVLGEFPPVIWLEKSNTQDVCRFFYDLEKCYSPMNPDLITPGGEGNGRVRNWGEGTNRFKGFFVNSMKALI